MPEAEKETRELAVAERHIVEGEERVTNQILLIEDLRRDGHDVTDAEKLLRTLQGTLVAWQGHRESILQTLERKGLMRHSR
jgi:hypothetical protein